MLMLELTFYKGVPFDSENENVLFCSKQDRDEFLEQYEINVVPIQLTDKWFLNGTDEQCFLTVSLNQEPFNANYLKVIQTLVEPKTLVETRRVLFFFINSYKQGAENSVELNLTLDKWNSYFMREEDEIISIPELKNALCVQGHRFENGGEIEEIMKPDKSLNDYEITRFSSVPQFRIVLHCTIKRVGGESIGLTDDEICFVSESALNISLLRGNLALTDNIQFARIYNVNDTSSTGIYQVKIIDIYAIPNDFIGSITDEQFDGILTENYNAENPNSYTSVYRIKVAKKVIQPTFLIYEKTFQITPQKAKITLFGTGRTNVELPYNNKTYNAIVRTAIGTDISIELFINNQFFDITNDYKGNVTIDEYLSFNAQNRNAENTRRISESLTTVGAGMGLLGSLATGNVLGILGSGLGLAQNLTSRYSNESKLKDLANQPIKLNSNLNLVGILNFSGGLAVYTITPANYDDIIATDNYYGFNFNGFYDLLTIANENDDRFRFLKCNEIQIIGEFNFDVKKYFEYLFKRGLRIWYNKNHFIDSMNQKLTQEEIEE